MEKSNQLDREKNIKIPDCEVGYIKRKFLDLCYGNESEAQKLDIYLPEIGEGKFPVIIAIHSGAFAIGDKRDIQLVPHLHALDKGYAVVSINYRLSGEAKFPAGLFDVKKAIRWVKANADRYMIDNTRIALWGGSAGGYYTIMAAATAGINEFEGVFPDDEQFDAQVQAAVDWFGPMNFIKMDEQLAAAGLGPLDHNDEDSPESRLLGAKITEIPDLVDYANPINYISDKMPPTFIQHGDRDHIVPLGQSLLLMNKLSEKLAENKYGFEILVGADHADCLFEQKENIDKVIDFLDKHLK